MSWVCTAKRVALSLNDKNSIDLFSLSSNIHSYNHQAQAPGSLFNQSVSSAFLCTQSSPPLIESSVPVIGTPSPPSALPPPSSLLPLRRLLPLVPLPLPLPLEIPPEVDGRELTSSCEGENGFNDVESEAGGLTGGITGGWEFVATG